MLSDEIIRSEFIKRYKDFSMEYLKYSFPDLDEEEMNEAIEYSIEKRYKETKTSLYNNYKNKSLDATLLDMTDYILTRNPIVAPSGCLFKRHSETENLFSELLETFINNRIKHKAEMFKYPKGSTMFEKYNLLQKLDKIDARSLVSLNPSNCWKFLKLD